MKKASSSFLVLFFAALLVSFQSFAQRVPDRRPTPQQPDHRMPEMRRMIHERVGQSMRMYERLRLSDLLRLSLSEQRNMEILSLSLMADHLGAGQSQLELSQHGRIIAVEIVRKNLREVKFKLPQKLLIDGLELSSPGQIYLDSIIAEVSDMRPIPQPDMQVQPNAFLTLQVNQNLRGRSELPLKQMVKQQLGLSLDGAEIDRVVVEGQPMMNGRAASVQVELNNRLVGPLKYLSPVHKQVPLPINSMEDIRTLKLVVNGEAIIHSVRIRIGNVRPQYPQHQPSARILVRQEVSQYMPLELSRLLGYDHRLIRSITVEARSMRQMQASLSLMSQYEFIGSVVVSQHSSRALLILRRPMALHELRLEASMPVLVEALEIDFL